MKFGENCFNKSYKVGILNPEEASGKSETNIESISWLRQAWNFNIIFQIPVIMMEASEKVVEFKEKLMNNLMSCADNESGYEDGVSDVNDTLNDSIDTADTVTESRDNDDKDEVIRDLVDNTSSLTIDTSTRLVLVHGCFYDILNIIF